MNNTKASNPSKSTETKIYVASTKQKGSFNLLGDIIDICNINASTTDIVSTMHNYLNRLTEIQASVFKAYFWRQSTIEEMTDMFSFNSDNYTKQVLNAAIFEYVDMLKADYGTK